MSFVSPIIHFTLTPNPVVQKCHFPPIEDAEVEGGVDWDWVCSHCSAYEEALEDVNFTFGTREREGVVGGGRQRAREGVCVSVTV